MLNLVLKAELVLRDKDINWAVFIWLFFSNLYCRASRNVNVIDLMPYSIERPVLGPLKSLSNDWHSAWLWCIWQMFLLTNLVEGSRVDGGQWRGTSTDRWGFAMTPMTYGTGWKIRSKNWHSNLLRSRKSGIGPRSSQFIILAIAALQQLQANEYSWIQSHKYIPTSRVQLWHENCNCSYSVLSKPMQWRDHSASWNSRPLWKY